MASIGDLIALLRGITDQFEQLTSRLHGAGERVSGARTQVTEAIDDSTNAAPKQGLDAMANRHHRARRPRRSLRLRT